MSSMETVVIGAGLAGLSFAYHYDKSTPVFERSCEVGGLARTTEVSGCRFDQAPHLLHMRSDYVKELVFDVLGLSMKAHERRARIFCEGHVIPYPFELNLYGVGEQVRRDCLRGLEEIDFDSRRHEEDLKSGSYLDYVLRAFGRGIGEHYLLPYNRKIWATNPADITCEWMSRLPTADVEKIREAACKPQHDGFGYNAHFYYPEKYGMRELPDALAATLSNVHLQKEVMRIDTHKRRITFADGDTIGYSRLVSSMPLPALATCTGRDDLINLASGLSHTTVYVVNLVVRGTVPEDTHWMYFPDPELDFFRISFPCRFFRKATSNGEKIISVEVASRNQGLDIHEIGKSVERQVRGLSIFEIEEHLFTHYDKIPVAYSIYDFERTSRVDRLKSALDKEDIHSLGRYGQWDYSAMEDALLYGKALADQIRSTT